MLLSIVVDFFLLLLLVNDKNDGEKDLFKVQRWRISDVVIAVVLLQAYPFYYVLVAYIFLKCGIDLRPFIHALSSRDISLYTSVLLLVLLVLAFKFKFKQGVTILGVKKANLRKNIGLGVLVGFVAFLAVDGLFLLILPKQFETKVVEMVTTLKTPMDYVILLGGAVFLGPLVEEVVYRGILYSPFRKKYGPIKAIIIASLFFACAHPNLLKAFLSAIFLTTLYEITESIISTFVAHSTINLLVLASAIYYLR